MGLQEMMVFCCCKERICFLYYLVFIMVFFFFFEILRNDFFNLQIYNIGFLFFSLGLFFLFYSYFKDNLRVIVDFRQNYFYSYIFYGLVRGGLVEESVWFRDMEKEFEGKLRILVEYI